MTNLEMWKDFEAKGRVFGDWLGNDGSISELKSMSLEDMAERVRFRIVNACERVGDLDGAVKMLAQDLAARQ